MVEKFSLKYTARIRIKKVTHPKSNFPFFAESIAINPRDTHGRQ
jgi:hypothetical protein